SWRESEAQFIKAAETFRRQGMVWQEAQTFQSWRNAVRAGGDRRAAIEKLDMAIEIYRRHGASQSWIDGVEGDLASTNGGNGASAAQSGNLQAPTSPRAVFRREGDYWTVSLREHLGRLRSAEQPPGVTR